MFKVGDWVRIYGNPTQILRIEGIETNEPEYYDYPTGYRDGCLNEEGLELWKPEQGDYCWFYFIDLSNPILGQFSGYELGGLPTFNNGRNCADSCEPFIGELPICYKSM